MRVASEIAGSIWKILVTPGDIVADGDTIMLIESMKMEIPVAAPGGGQIGSICVSEGEAVVEGQVLAEIEPS